jgi:hypothetical protein
MPTAAAFVRYWSNSGHHAAPLISNHSDTVDFDVERPGPGRHMEEDACRGVGWKVPRIDLIERTKMGFIGRAVHIALDYAIHRRTCSLKLCRQPAPCDLSPDWASAAVATRRPKNTGWRMRPYNKRRTFSRLRSPSKRGLPSYGSSYCPRRQIIAFRQKPTPRF